MPDTCSMTYTGHCWGGPLHGEIVTKSCLRFAITTCYPRAAPSDPILVSTGYALVFVESQPFWIHETASPDDVRETIWQAVNLTEILVALCAQAAALNWRIDTVRLSRAAAANGVVMPDTLPTDPDLAAQLGQVLDDLAPIAYRLHGIGNI